MDSVRKYTKVILNIVIPLIIVWAVCVLGPKLLRFFLPFVIGWLIAMIANPLVRFLEKRVKIVRRHSSVLIIVVVLAGVIGLLYLLISRLVIQGAAFARDLPELYETISIELQTVFRRFDGVFRRLPGSVQETWTEITDNIGAYLSLAVQKIASPTVEVAGNVAKGIPNALVMMIVTIMSSYFFIAERDKIIEFWRIYLPEGSTHYYQYLRKEVKRLIGGYFLAQFRIMFVVAVILAVGFVVLGVRYGLLLAVLIAILDFLPLFGTGTALIPWALVRVLSGDYAFAVGLALLYVLTQVVRQMIQPKIVGDSMGLPPLWTLLFLYLGFKWHGISGMILAVPLGMFVLSLYRYGAFDSLIENLKILIHDVNEFRKS